MVQIKPLHTHDCDKCVLLGNVRDLRAGESDVYWCPDENSLILRRSSEPSNYASFHVNIARTVGSDINGSPIWAVATAMYDAFVHQSNGRNPS